MIVTALVDSIDHVCCRYRIAAFQSAFRRGNISLVIQPIPNGLIARLKCWAGLRNSDVVIVQRRLLPPFHVKIIRRYARRLIYDFDDAIYHRSSYTKKKHDSRTRARRFTTILRAADAVVAGNEHLKRKAAKWIDPDRIHVIPTCVDPDHYAMAAHDEGRKQLQLVWIGSASTLRGLQQQSDMLDFVAHQRTDVGCKIICDKFPHFFKMPISPTPWADETEAAEIASADVGISWLPDDDWSRGKCGLKILQYMAAGLPVVTNPVGVHLDMIRHGQNGYLARTPAEWADAIGRLADAPRLRRTMGQSGRTLVERSYSVEFGAKTWLSLL